MSIEDIFNAVADGLGGDDGGDSGDAGKIIKQGLEKGQELLKQAAGGDPEKATKPGGDPAVASAGGSGGGLMGAIDALNAAVTAAAGGGAAAAEGKAAGAAEKPPPKSPIGQVGGAVTGGAPKAPPSVAVESTAQFSTAAPVGGGFPWTTVGLALGAGLVVIGGIGYALQDNSKPSAPIPPTRRAPRHESE